MATFTVSPDTWTLPDWKTVNGVLSCNDSAARGEQKTQRDAA
jgi:hypothetical protein